jgi:hypothetical protein
MSLQKQAQAAMASGAAAAGPGMALEVANRANFQVDNGVHDLRFRHLEAVTDQAFWTVMAGIFSARSHGWLVGNSGGHVTETHSHLNPS